MLVSGALSFSSGLSHRTVQRIENEGRCSIDSKKALAAAFDLDVVELNIKPEANILEKSDSQLKVAISWLETVDSGKYDFSWRETAPLFKNRISNKKWVKELTKVRMPLGNVVSRAVKSASKYNSLAGAPDGQYIVITLEASYELKQSAIETVTLNKINSDWRIVGYFIQ